MTTKILTGPQVGQALMRFAADARDQLVLISPWLSRRAVAPVLQARQKPHPKTSIVFRWPVSGTEAPLVDLALLKDLLRRRNSSVDLRYIRDSREPLHAKLYVTDGRQALIGSANLTGKGTGLGAGEPNREACVLVSKNKAADEAADLADGLLEESFPLTRAALKVLERWKAEQPADWSGPADPPPAGDPVHDALVRAREVGTILAFKHVGHGFGRYAYKITRKGRKTPVMVKARRSEASELADGRLHYHQEVHRSDYRNFTLPRAERTASALLFVQTERTEDGERLVEDAPVVLVGLDELFHPRQGIVTKSWFRRNSRRTAGVGLYGDEKGWRLLGSHSRREIAIAAKHRLDRPLVRSDRSRG